LTGHADAEVLLGSQEKIKAYVSELIEEIESIKKRDNAGKTR
jgi:hypothetical protein